MLRRLPLLGSCQCRTQTLSDHILVICCVLLQLLYGSVLIDMALCLDVLCIGQHRCAREQMMRAAQAGAGAATRVAAALNPNA